MKHKATIYDVEKALDELAVIIEEHPFAIAATPIYERLERDLADMKAHQAVTDRIRRRAQASHQAPATRS